MKKYPFQNIYTDQIGTGCKISNFVEICKGAIIGNNCNIQSFCFIPANVVIKDNVFIGPGVIFTNDKYPPSNGEWKDKQPTVISQGVSIGAGSIILPGVHIGEFAMIGAGSVVTKNIEKNVTVKGNPAK